MCETCMNILINVCCFFNCYLFFLFPISYSLDFIMSVDKFGRFSGSNANSQPVRGPKGEGFNLTKTGDYDIQLKRICNVAAPTEIGDAVNLETLKGSLGKCLLVTEGKIYDAQGFRISNTGEPINDSDVVNKLYFTSNTPVKLKDSYSVHQYRIQDLAAPLVDGDAVNFHTFYNKAIVTNKGSFTARGLKITNLHDPKIGQDAVNLRFLQANTLFLKGKEYDAKGHVIKNLPPPISNGDAVNYAYLSDVLAEMSYALHKVTKKGGHKLVTKEEWKRKVVKSLHTCDWGELFGTSENALVQPLSDEPKTPVINTGGVNDGSH
jgi:hypothetical protein